VNCIDELCGQRGNAGKALNEIERHAFGGKNRARGT
jgi:hypothetical protein